jgi:hypothetical protein
MISNSPGTVLQNGGEWMYGVGEYSTKHFYRHGANSGTHTTGSINLFEINNNLHWGGVHMDIEVWETYFTPGYRKYEYHNSGGTYDSGGALAQVSQTNIGGARCLHHHQGGHWQGWIRQRLRQPHGEAEAQHSRVHHVTPSPQKG